MIAQVKTIDNQKNLLAIAGSAPSGNPVGTIISTYRKIQPRNYLYCDGSTFNAGTYPALYLYLGTNVLPDYRECALVGAEKNTTDVFDSTETNPSTGNAGTQSHDVYAEGEFKDDQLQNITGKIDNTAQGTGDQFLTDTATSSIVNEGALSVGDSKSRYSISNTSGTGNYPSSLSFDASRVARTGDVTHGKRKAVYYYIKAVDGVDISDEDTFLVTVENFIAEREHTTFFNANQEYLYTSDVTNAGVTIDLSSVLGNHYNGTKFYYECYVSVRDYDSGDHEFQVHSDLMNSATNNAQPIYIQGNENSRHAQNSGTLYAQRYIYLTNISASNTRRITLWWVKAVPKTEVVLLS